MAGGPLAAINAVLANRVGDITLPRGGYRRTPYSSGGKLTRLSNARPLERSPRPTRFNAPSQT
jgi:hypothetical protein